MCGIAGYYDRNVSREQLVISLQTMLRAQQHRGPDDNGIWTAPSRGLAIGHQRLSIQDLSAAGHQPMIWGAEQYVLSYNGEIYNAAEIKRQLPNTIAWQGTSDTEVLLHALARWGVADTVARLEGMFAFAWWDSDQGQLTLVRDRLGIKPLFYSVQGDRFYFASELAALLANASFQAEVEPTALADFMRFGYVRGPQSMLRRSWKLAPGHFIYWNVSRCELSQPQVYWDPCKIADSQRAFLQNRHPLTSGFNDDEGIDVDEAEVLFERVIREHTVSDVPVGAFLSGGIDSSLVTALLQRSSTQRVRTFSLGFDDPDFDESQYARQVAVHLGTDHEEFRVEDRDVADVVPAWSSYYSEPLSDTSGLPTILLCRAAREHVTVALSGDGGDELFGGYTRYGQFQSIAARVRAIPLSMRRLAQTAFERLPAGLLYRLDPLQRALAPHLHEGPVESVRKLASLIGCQNERQIYETMAAIAYGTAARSLIGHDMLRALPTDAGEMWQSFRTPLDNMQLWDTKYYLPDDILHKVDIASMSVGLEVRVPLLDHRVFAWSWSLPAHWRRSGGLSKVILRRLLARHLPSTWFARRKRGFSAPLDRWLRTTLRPWAESLLRSAVLRESAWFDHRAIDSAWRDLLAARAGHARIWPVLVFLAWHEHYLSNRGGRSDANSLRNARHDSLSIRRVPQYAANVPHARESRT